MAITISETSGSSLKTARECEIKGLPRSSEYIFEVIFSCCHFRKRNLAPAAGMITLICCFITGLSKNHAPGLRLKDAGNGHGKILPDPFTAVIYNHHRSVIQIRNTLVMFLTFL